MSHTGHLFVIHGKIEHLVHDAAIVPVDGYLEFNPYWEPLLGSPWPAAPATWNEGWGRIESKNQWLVEVGDGNYDLVLDRLTRILDDVKSADVGALGGRSLPLVALPVVGVGLGGHGHEPGRVLRRLVHHLVDASSRLELDIAVVTPDHSVYAAAQFARAGLPSPLPPEGEEAAAALGQRARVGDLALFLGAGVSIPAGLISWNSLIQDLAAAVGVKDGDLESGLSATDQAELIERADPKGFKERVAALARSATRPALLHALLAGLDAREVVTTNYDRLYETAVEATRREVASVMPWSSALGAERWILKLHGDIDHVDGIVLTRRHMVRYDAANRPSAAMLQSLFLTKHLLVVGASLTDDNVVRLAHEVQAYREEHQEDVVHQPFGTVLDASERGDRVRARLWEGQLEWLHLTDLEVGNSRRALELLLDRIALHASSTSSWLLDKRFAGLLDDDADRELADQARRLFGGLPADDDSKWRPLRDRLLELGVTDVSPRRWHHPFVEE